MYTLGVHLAVNLVDLTLALTLTDACYDRGTPRGYT